MRGGVLPCPVTGNGRAQTSSFFVVHRVIQHMSVLLYVHQKREDVWALLLPLTRQGNTPSLILLSIPYVLLRTLFVMSHSSCLAWKGEEHRIQKNRPLLLKTNRIILISKIFDRNRNFDEFLPLKKIADKKWLGNSETFFNERGMTNHKISLRLQGLKNNSSIIFLFFDKQQESIS